MTDLSTTSWSETDGSNNQASPLGAPEGMAPSGVNNTMRAMMGATKRFWSRINGTVKTTNVGDAYTYTPPVAAPALVDGEIYTFRCNAANTGPATLDVGIGGAQSIVKSDGLVGSAVLTANDLLPGIYYQAAWDSLSSHFVVLNTGVGAAVGSLSADVNAAIRSTSAAIKLDIDSVSAAIKIDIGSVSAAITSAFSASDRSTSSVIKLDISSVSSGITSAIRSTSSTIKLDISSVSAVISAQITSAIAAAITAAKSALFPVGSLYCNYNVATNPATLLGFGTWTALAAGRSLWGAGIGVDSSGSTLTLLATSTFGDYYRTLSATEIEHRHALPNETEVTGQGGTGIFTKSNTTGPVIQFTGSAFGIVPPGETVYIWRRTA